jgi:hypothetical protein
MIFSDGGQKTTLTLDELALQQEIFSLFQVVLSFLKEHFMLQKDLLPHFAPCFLMTLFKHMWVYLVQFQEKCVVFKEVNEEIYAFNTPHEIVDHNSD